jgi:hypothetical protein
MNELKKLEADLLALPVDSRATLARNGMTSHANCNRC